MTKIIVLPHETLCPEGRVIEAKAGQSLCKALLEAGIEIEHACEMSCACTTCHVIVHEGRERLNDASETEEDMLDRAWGLQPDSRLSCQVRLADGSLTVEIPKYTVNIVKEGKS